MLSRKAQLYLELLRRDSNIVAGFLTLRPSQLSYLLGGLYVTTPCGESGNGGIWPNSPGGGATGRNEQIAALYQQHKGALFGYCLNLIGDIDLANDMVQDTFCKALEAWDREIVRDPRAWLYRLARNNCFNYLKQSNTQNVSLSDRWGADCVSSALQTGRMEDDVLERVAIEEALQKLTEDQRQIMAWYYDEGYNCREIAEKLDIGHGAARERLRCARDAFKQAYAG